MDEWDGTGVRELFYGNVSGMLDVAVKLHSNLPNAAKLLVERIRGLVLASLNSHDPADMRGPLSALVNVLATHAPVFVTSPYLYDMYLIGRVFVIAAMTVVDLDKEPTVELANEEKKPIRMSAKRKQVLPEEETPTSSKRKLLIPKEEDSPIIIEPKRRSSRNPGMAVLDESLVDESVADSPRFHPVAVKAEVFDDDEIKKCDYCDMEVCVSEMEQVKHMWKKHKHLVYKYIRPELVCTVDYCDYVSSSVNARKIHVGKTHGAEPPDQSSVVSELKASKCPYCATEIDSIVSLKQHVLQCTQRDEGPLLGCSSCPEKSFHFIFDFTTHLKKLGGVAHGQPTLWTSDE